ncbi:MAG: hypothetical protein OSB41_02165 [Kiritimatiellae bacterium]|nr:hypothetical protein [Kiritimatiellia bacterium]
MFFKLNKWKIRTRRALRARIDLSISRRLEKELCAATPGPGRDVFLFSHDVSPYSEKLYLLIAHELARRGNLCTFLFRPSWGRWKGPSLRAGTLDLGGLTRVGENVKSQTIGPRGCERSREWVVDFESEVVCTEGINVFGVLRSSLRAYFKRYNLDYNSAELLAVAEDMVDSCDHLFDVFFSLLDYAKAHNVHVTIVGREWAYLPNGVFQLLANTVPTSREVEYVDIGRGYINYFGHPLMNTYATVRNLSRCPQESGLAVTKAELADFLANELPVNVNVSVERALQTAVAGGESRGQPEVLQRAEQHRKDGGHVFVLLAHLFYDTLVEDSSSTFPDMCAWVRETIEFFRGRDDLLLLKPHPYEIYPGHEMREPSETLASFVQDAIGLPLPDNILLLEPRSLSLADLQPHLSCGLVWRSSAGMELAYMQTPAIIAGCPPYSALDMEYVHSRDEYFLKIADVETLSVSDELRQATAAYLYCLEHDQHLLVDCIEYRHAEGHLFVRKYFSRGKSDIQESVGPVADKIVSQIQP